MHGHANIKFKKVVFRLLIWYMIYFTFNKIDSCVPHLLGADEFPGPVKWTRPYFDCGRSNKWLVAAVVPIADIYPRHTGFRHIEYPT